MYTDIAQLFRLFRSVAVVLRGWFPDFWSGRDIKLILYAAEVGNRFCLARVTF